MKTSCKFSTFLLLFLLFAAAPAQAQSGHSVNVPQGVVYNYGRESLIDSAKALLTAELQQAPTYKHMGRILFVGPVLWSRWRKVKELAAIKGGNVTNLVDGRQLSGKMTQEFADARLMWDALRKEAGKGTIAFRYANARELAYYWSIISFDIDEPLLVLETQKHHYILNLSPDKLQLFYIEELPR